MRAPHELLHSRARVRQRYALFPLEGYPCSRLPSWPEAEARVLASPALGAGFVAARLDLKPGHAGGHPSDGRTETFLYLLSGTAELEVAPGGRHALTAGGFAFIPPAAGFTLSARSDSALLFFRKTYEPLPGTPAPTVLVGREADVPRSVYLGDEGALLQQLLPDEWAHDLAVNIFTFSPGHGLPVVETHVMEHGLLVLQGRGLYYLDDAWMEVDTDDFLWMGPYVPQSFQATGPVPVRYIYSKNVNRDLPPA